MQRYEKRLWFKESISHIFNWFFRCWLCLFVYVCQIRFCRIARADLQRSSTRFGNPSERIASTSRSPSLRTRTRRFDRIIFRKKLISTALYSSWFSLLETRRDLQVELLNNDQDERIAAHCKLKTKSACFVNVFAFLSTNATCVANCATCMCSRELIVQKISYFVHTKSSKLSNI